jgi:hypothetical protein
MRCNALFIMEIANMRGTLPRKKYLKDKGFLTAIRALSFRRDCIKSNILGGG